MRHLERTMLPSYLQKIYSREDIHAASVRLGAEITPWAKACHEKTGKDILTVPILRGGLFFFADLVREIDMSVEIAPARTWAYEETVAGVPRPKVTVNIDNVPATGRSILLVDDICDSGKTLVAIKRHLLEAGATEVRAAVLIKRILPDSVGDPDWIGFEYDGPEWMVGYGMDDGDRWRNLGAVYLIKK